MVGAIVTAQRQPDGTAMCKLDMEGQVTGCNEAAVEALGGRRPNDVIGKDFVTFVCEPVWDVGKAIRQAQDGDEANGVGAALVGRPDEVLDLAVKPSCGSPGAEPSGTVVTWSLDGGSKKGGTPSEYGENLSDAEVAQLADLDKQGIAGWFTNKGDKVEGCNKAAAAMQGRQPADVVGSDMVRDVVSRPDRSTMQDALDDATGTVSASLFRS